jgi:hypothetical protein
MDQPKMEQTGMEQILELLKSQIAYQARRDAKLEAEKAEAKRERETANEVMMMRYAREDFQGDRARRAAVANEDEALHLGAGREKEPCIMS